jgi:hypothetical protein
MRLPFLDQEAGSPAAALAGCSARTRQPRARVNGRAAGAVSATQKEPRRMVIRRIAPLSLAKIAGLLYSIIGFIVGLFFALAGLIGFAAGAAASPDTPAIVGALFGVGAIILLPIFYGCLGFVGAALMAFLYNVLANVVGGIELEVR